MGLYAEPEVPGPWCECLKLLGRKSEEATLETGMMAGCEFSSGLFFYFFPGSLYAIGLEDYIHSVRIGNCRLRSQACE